MNKNVKKALSIALVLAMAGSMVGGVKPETPAYAASKVKAKISQKSVVLKKGKSIKLSLTGAKGRVKWKSSNKKVVKVNRRGKVKAKKPGTAIITATFKKKNYTCKVTVYGTKKLGSAVLTQDKTEATIGGIGVGFSPGTISKKSTVTVSSVSGVSAPKNSSGGKAYDFSLKGSKIDAGKDVVKLEIPLTVPEGKTPVAAYFNESTGKYEPMLCDYRDGKVEILTDHFSIYYAGLRDIYTGADPYLENEGTTKEYASGFYSLPKMSGGPESLGKSLAEAIQNDKPTFDMTVFAAGMLNDLFPAKIISDSNMEKVRAAKAEFDNDPMFWISDVFLGLTDLFGQMAGYESIDETMGDLFGKIAPSELITGIGFVNGYLGALKEARDGDKNYAAMQACFTGISTTQSIWAGGTLSLSAAGFVTAVVSYSLTRLYGQMIEDKEKAWKAVYDKYYKTEKKRSVYAWKDIFLKCIEGKTQTEAVELLEKEVDDWARAFFKQDYAWLFSWYHELIPDGGLNKTLFRDKFTDEALTEKIVQTAKNEIYNGPLKDCWDWYMIKCEREAQKKALELAAQMVAPMKKTATIQFYDGKAGKTSNMAGYTVRLKEVPQGITDKANTETVLDKKGTGKISFTLWTWMKYGFKPIVEVVDKKGGVVNTVEFKWNLKGTKVDVSPNYDVALDSTELTFDEIGASKNLSLIKTQDGNKEVIAVDSWTIDGKDKDCIKVDNNKGVAAITALKSGTATVSCEYEGKTYTCKVTVAVSYFLNITDMKITNLTEGFSLLLQTKVNGSVENVKGAVFTNNLKSDIAKVEKNGDGLSVFGLKNGSGTITCTYEGQTYTCNVTIAIEEAAISLSETDITLKKGETKTIYLVEVSADGKETKLAYEKGGIDSNGQKVAKTSKDGTYGFKITALAAGSTNVHVMYKGNTYSCKVTVTEEAGTEKVLKIEKKLFYPEIKYYESVEGFRNGTEEGTPVYGYGQIVISPVGRDFMESYLDSGKKPTWSVSSSTVVTKESTLALELYVSKDTKAFDVTCQYQNKKYVLKFGAPILNQEHIVGNQPIYSMSTGEWIEASERYGNPEVKAGKFYRDVASIDLDIDTGTTV